MYVCMSVCMFVCLCVCGCVFLLVCLFVHLFVCLFVCIYLHVCHIHVFLLVYATIMQLSIYMFICKCGGMYVWYGTVWYRM